MGTRLLRCSLAFRFISSSSTSVRARKLRSSLDIDGLQSPIRRLNNIFRKQRHRNMKLKRLEVYQKEYRKSSSATIEKGNAKHMEIYWTECTRSVERGQP